MPPPLPDPEIDDEDYASEEDSDFAPDEEEGVAGDDANGEAGESSEDSEADQDGTTTTKAAPTSSRKRKQQQDGDGEDAGFENSGDEAIIEKGKKRRKRGQQKQADEEEGGEGGLIKTRSMRAVEYVHFISTISSICPLVKYPLTNPNFPLCRKAERKAQAVTGPVTIDVDALWASMTAAPVVPTKEEGDPSATKDNQDPSSQAEGSSDPQKQKEGRSETIKIKRTYKFAGKVHTEEKVVARDTAEARLYLASHPEADIEGDDNTNPEAGDEEDKEKKRMPRKAFRSIFEPVLDPQQQLSARTDLNLAIAVRLRAREEAEAAAKAKKLNTVEKSRMDWAGFVDKEGIKDELALAGRAKGSFADRQDFLARSEARREEDARRVRLAGKV